MPINTISITGNHGPKISTAGCYDTTVMHYECTTGPSWSLDPRPLLVRLACYIGNMNIL